MRSNGAVACWGSNLNGELGDGIFAQSSIPVPVFGIDDAIEVSVDDDHVCLVRATGTVRCFGEGRDGQLGNALPGTAIPVTTATLPEL